MNAAILKIEKFGNRIASFKTSRHKIRRQSPLTRYLNDQGGCLQMRRQEFESRSRQRICFCIPQCENNIKLN